MQRGANQPAGVGVSEKTGGVGRMDPAWEPCSSCGNVSQPSLAGWLCAGGWPRGWRGVEKERRRAKGGGVVVGRRSI